MARLREHSVAGFFQKQDGRPTTPMQALMEAAPGDDVQVSSVELPESMTDALRQALSVLTEDERDMVLMHAAGISVREIAEMVGIPRSTVHRKLPRLMERVTQEARRAHATGNETSDAPGGPEDAEQA